jgi:hypothetical protein
VRGSSSGVGSSAETLLHQVDRQILSGGPVAILPRVSSRQEEKERRRQERVAREQAEARVSARRKRLQMVFGAVLAVAAVAGVIVAVVVGGGSDSEKAATAPTDVANLPKLPVQQISDVQEAAKAAGCTVTNAQYEGAGHEEKDFKPSDYKTNPPTSGAHFPDWYQDGIYAPGTVPNLGMLVHTLEHGRINVQYKPGTPDGTVKKLEAILAESNDGYHMLLYQNTSGMDSAVAATAWTHLLACPSYNDKVIDAVRTFRTRYIDKGPESVP